MCLYDDQRLVDSMHCGLTKLERDQLCAQFDFKAIGRSVPAINIWSYQNPLIVLLFLLLSFFFFFIVVEVLLKKNTFYNCIVPVGFLPWEI